MDLTEEESRVLLAFRATAKAVSSARRLWLAIASAAGSRSHDEMLDLMAMPVSELDLSVRAGDCLDSENIKTIGELCRLKEDDLVKVRNFGRVTLAEVKQKLAKLSLSLGMNAP